MAQTITAVLFGAGLRGADAYAPYALAHPDELKFVAVAEPDPMRRTQFATDHNIPAERQFTTWEEVVVQPKMADAVFNCTQDQMHHASGMVALKAGYDMLLEKPIANTLTETVELVKTAEENDCLLQICHVLRTTPFFSTLNDILQSGRLGDIITVEHRENVAYHHMAHSFVRGPWRNEALSSPMILAKSCHDLDILVWNMGVPVKRLQSFGSLRHFRLENAPEGATLYCTDDCPVAETCPFDACRVYLTVSKLPITSEYPNFTRESLKETLETEPYKPYGRCVYHCDNSVVDNQTVNMEFEDGTTVVFTMHGHSHLEGRTMRYDGTRATLRGSFTNDGDNIEIHDHLTRTTEQVEIPDTDGTGHGGGDFGIVKNFVQAINGNIDAITDARTSLESHLMAFAAEESRQNNSVINMDEYRGRYAAKTGGK